MSRFASEYLVDLNAMHAAIRAGYSPKTARQIGAANLSKPVISAEIEMRLEIRKHELKIDSDWFLQCLLEDKDADMRDLCDEDNQAGFSICPSCSKWLKVQYRSSNQQGNHV